MYGLEQAARAAGDLGTRELLDALAGDEVAATPALSGSPFTAHAVRQLCAQQAVAAALVVVALRRHAVVHGTLPEDTSLLRTSRGDPLPPDPFTGEPIGYARTSPTAAALTVTDCEGLGAGARPEGQTRRLEVSAR